MIEGSLGEFAKNPVVRQVLDRIPGMKDGFIQEIVGVAEIAAPTFFEGERAQYISRRFREEGLSGITLDEAGNVYGRWPGKGDEKETLLVVAHLDTVFPLGTDVTVREEAGRLHGPGVGDDSAGLAALILLARLLKQHRIATRKTVILAGSVGEEGLGDLKGMKALMDRFRGQVQTVIGVEPGPLGRIVNRGVGSRRFKVTCRTEGGHSWGAFGKPSAIHSLGRMIAGIAGIKVPQDPRTTFNVGLISGGTSVNTIAPAAEMIIDLRSVDQSELLRLEAQVKELVEGIAGRDRVNVSFQLLGDRPAGGIGDEHPLVKTIEAIHGYLGIKSVRQASSTDANVPFSLGIPAVTLGLTQGANGHRTDEYIDTAPLTLGLQQLFLATAAVAEVMGEG